MKRKRILSIVILIIVFLYCVPCAQAAEIKGDAEAVSHGDEAAMLQVEEKETLPDFVFRQYNLAVLSHYSYLIGSGGEALIVDPARDIDRYVKDAEDLGLKITRVYLTHSHADFVAGHIELMEATGAEIIVNKKIGAKYKHTEVDEGSEIRFGDVRTLIRTTPGHTPDGSVLYVYHPAKAENPKLVLTGDTLFIGSVGRPDLLEGSYTSAQLAAMLFQTWNEKLSRVPDETRLYPAHGAGSLCGVHLSDSPVSTFGEQKKVNAYLQHKDLSTFVMAVIDGLREPPQYFRHNAAMNREGPNPVDWNLKMPPALTPQQVEAAVGKGAWLIDVRDAGAFAEAHVPQALNIGIRGRFETWTGIMIPWGEPFVLIGSEVEVAEATFRLHRIGYDSPTGYLAGGTAAWIRSGLSQEKVALVTPQDLYGQMKKGTAPIIVDVRLPTEWMALRIGDILNLPIDRLFTEAKRLDPSMPVLMVCNSAYRSSMAAGVMQKLGFEDIRNLEGGSQAWIDAGLPTYGADKIQKAAPGDVYAALPERVSPADLARTLMDLPGSLDIVDIRPAWQFNEYHIPGAVNVPVQELMRNPDYLEDRRPLVIVCRDGQISAAVGGVLTQKSRRPIRFLSGGVVQYYDEIMRPKGIRSDTIPSGLPNRSTAPTASPGIKAPASGGTPAPGRPDPPPERKKSAGC